MPEGKQYNGHHFIGVDLLISCLTTGGKRKKKLSYEWRRIEHFFEFFNQGGASEELWEMLKLALTNDEEETEGRERSNMIFLYEYTKELYENIYILLQGQKDKTRKK